MLVKAGSGATTFGVPDSKGVPKDSVKNTLQVPFNDAPALTSMLERNSGEVATVIIEPVMGNVGPIPPQDNYLSAVQKITKENDVLLILDEVITGFRLALGGAQEFYGIDADLYSTPVKMALFISGALNIIPSLRISKMPSPTV